jgi:DNA-directed RNA polymerase subunit RPC12/RpoP
MRFCPYCSTENDEESVECKRCGHRLLPMPQRTGTRTTGTATTVVADTRPPGSRPPPTPIPSTPSTGAGWEPSPSSSPGSAPASQPISNPGASTGPEPATLSGAQPSASSGPASGLAWGEGSPARSDASYPESRPGSEPAPESRAESRPASESPPESRPPSETDAEPDTMPGVGDGGARYSRAATGRARRTAPMPSSMGGPIREELDELSRADGAPADAEGGTLPGTGAFPEPTLAPPPTRQVAPPPGGSAAQLPVLDPLPEPEAGLWSSARYAVSFVRGTWQRRAAVRELQEQIRIDTTALDGLLGSLGRTTRALRLDNRTLAAENQGIDDAERRRAQAETDSVDLVRRLEEENQRFAEQEQDRENKLAEAQAALAKADKELETLEAQRRSLRDKRKTVERQQRAYLKTAADRETDAAKAQSDDDRAQLSRAAEELRREAAALDPERQDFDRRLGALEKPVSQTAARVEALRGEQESIRRALRDLREGHRHRLSENEAEQGRKSREATTAEAEIGRRLVTLGTLLNLNRVERPEFDELYARIDQLRGAIGTRTNEIDRLIAERDAFDRGALLRGTAVLLFALIALITVAVVGIALL